MHQLSRPLQLFLLHADVAKEHLRQVGHVQYSPKQGLGGSGSSPLSTLQLDLLPPVVGASPVLLNQKGMVGECANVLHVTELALALCHGCVERELRRRMWPSGICTVRPYDWADCGMPPICTL